MMICYTSYTALEFWRWQARTASTLERPRPTQCSLLRQPCAPAADIKAACRHFHDPAFPIHVLTAEKGSHRKDIGIHPHRIVSEPPRGSLFKLGNGLFVASPEYAFMQCCLSSSRITAIRLASELCSSFVYCEEDERGFVKCEPIMTVEALESLAKCKANTNGINELRKIAPHVIAGAASPREVAVALLLSLPMRTGGYGLEKPLVNKRISLNSMLRDRHKRPYISADLLWSKSRTALEYDSDAWHTLRADIARDSRRRKLFDDLGIEVITLTNDEMKSPSELQHIAEKIARRQGKRFRITIDDFALRNRELRRALLSQNHDYWLFPTETSNFGK